MTLSVAATLLLRACGLLPYSDLALVIGEMMVRVVDTLIKVLFERWVPLEEDPVGSM